MATARAACIAAVVAAILSAAPARSRGADFSSPRKVRQETTSAPLGISGNSYELGTVLFEEEPSLTLRPVDQPVPTPFEQFIFCGTFLPQHPYRRTRFRGHRPRVMETEYDGAVNQLHSITYDLGRQSLKWDARERTLLYRTNALNAWHISTLLLLLALPGDVTKWTEDDQNLSQGEIARKFKKNLADGFEWDKDEPFFNILAHPYQGGTYYVVARKAGFGKAVSFWYGFFASTFLWEHSIEALAEEPSVQDFIITPYFGMLVGEAMLRKERQVRRDGKRVLGSRSLGGFTLFLMDPLGHITRGLEQAGRFCFGRKVQGQLFREIRTRPFYMRAEPYYDVLQGVRRRNYTGFRLTIRH